jgi:hypothetical protein
MVIHTLTSCTSAPIKLSSWEELESIPAEERANPIALRLRVYIYRDKGKWMEMAEDLPASYGNRTTATGALD